MRFKLSTLFLTFLSPLCFGNEDINRLNALELLKEDLAPNVKTLQREVKLYHWGSMPEISSNKSLLPGDPAWGEFFAQRGQLMTDFFYSSGGWDMAGTGMYYAADPYKSREYGDTLVETVISKGVNFLDIRENKSRHHQIRKVTIDALESICGGLDYQSTHKEGYVNIRKNGLTKEADCRHIFNQALSELGVQFYAYRWRSSPRFGVCARKNMGGDYDEAGFVLGGKVTINSSTADDISINFNDIKVNVYGHHTYENTTTSELKALILSGDENAYNAYYVDFVIRYQKAKGNERKILKESGLEADAFKGLYPFMQEQLEADMVEKQMGCNNGHREDRF